MTALLLLAASPCAAPGWCPGVPLTGAADPTTTPDPSSMIGNVVPGLRTMLFSSGGAALLAMVGVLALIRGWGWYTAMFRKPRQLALF